MERPTWVTTNQHDPLSRGVNLYWFCTHKCRPQVDKEIPMGPIPKWAPTWPHRCVLNLKCTPFALKNYRYIILKQKVLKLILTITFDFDQKLYPCSTTYSLFSPTSNMYSPILLYGLLDLENRNSHDQEYILQLLANKARAFVLVYI